MEPIDDDRDEDHPFDEHERPSKTSHHSFFQTADSMRALSQMAPPSLTSSYGHPWQNEDGNSWTCFPPFCADTFDEPPPPATPPDPIRRPRDLTSPPLTHRVTCSSDGWPSFALPPYPVQSPSRPLVESIGPPHLQIYRLRLPTSLYQFLQPIIQAAETHAASSPHGWQTKLYSLTKQDLALSQIPHGLQLVHPITEYILDSIRHLYNCQQVHMDRNQPHVLKYNQHHTGVELHHDKCQVTANLLLNDVDEYTGGGTFLPSANATVKLRRGEFLLHPGSLVHGGNPITSGTRYLLVYFCHLEE